MHAGIAEVAAAKARMFINKPDGSTLCFLMYLIYVLSPMISYTHEFLHEIIRTR